MRDLFSWLSKRRSPQPRLLSQRLRLRRRNSYLLAILILMILWLVGSSFWQSAVQPLIPERVYAYEVPDPCGLTVVVCPEEQQDVRRIIEVISILETNGCKTGVGKSKNNCTGTRSSGGYHTFTSPEESFAYSVSLWQRRYGALDLDDALHRWKDGNRPADQATINYINNFHRLYDKS